MKQEIQKLKEQLQEKEIDDDGLENLNQDKIKIFSNNLKLAEIFVMAYTNLKVNCDLSNCKKLSKSINDLEETYCFLRKELEELSNSTYGNNYRIQRIQNKVQDNRREIEEVVKIFLEVFSDGV